MSSVNHTAKILLIFFLLTVSIKAQQDTVSSSSNTDTVFVMHKSPWGAVLRSAVLPGLGQIYNESYVKAVVVWGIGGWLVYNWIINNNSYKDYKKLYLQTGSNTNREYRNFFRDQRDLFTIYLGLTYVLNLIDAYVDAQLFDFSVDEDFLTHLPRLNLKIKIF